MDYSSRHRGSRKRARNDLTVKVTAEEINGSERVAISSTRQSSRRRSSPRSDAGSVTSNSELSDLASKQKSVSPRIRLTRDTVAAKARSTNSTRRPSSINSEERRGHFTRSATPKPLENEDPPREATKEKAKVSRRVEPEETISIDACSSILASLDQRAYRRNLLSDANGISREILQPMALPWTHKGTPVTRNIPCDIDEMTEILTADDGSYSPFPNGPFGFGKFDIGQLRRPPLNTRLATSADWWCAAARRSWEPGIIELTSVTLPPSHAGILKADITYGEASHPQTPASGFLDQLKERGEKSTFAPGEIALRCFEQASSIKKRRLGEVQSCSEKKLISVRVNSSSSRASLLDDLHFDGVSHYEKVLEATLPQEVENGRFLSTTNAQTVSEKLGTYNWRHGLGPTNHTGRNANRLSCGRTRTIWTKKIPGDQPQRTFFTSLLTGSRLESGAQRRPREIKVILRVGNEIFGSKPKYFSGRSFDDSLNGFESSLLSEDRLLSSLFVHPRMECVLEEDIMVKSVLAERTSKASAGHAKANELSKSIWIPPLLDCLPDTNGFVNVSCTSSGKIAVESVHETLNAAATDGPLVCTVCWSARDGEGLQLFECSVCSTIAHSRCCYHPGEIKASSDGGIEDGVRVWRCRVCSMKHSGDSRPAEIKQEESPSEKSKKPRRKSRPPGWLKDSRVEESRPAQNPETTSGGVTHGIKCSFCPYSGGSMSLVQRGGESVWVHEVCRIWLPENVDPQPCDGIQTCCALCGKDGRKRASPSPRQGALSGKPVAACLVKCSAARCCVYFHPMCALVSSKLPVYGETEHSSRRRQNAHLLKSIQEDEELCTRYTLTALDCDVQTGAHGKDPGTSDTVTIPVAFCGFHNPKRDVAFRGLYPGGGFLSGEDLRVPAFKGGKEGFVLDTEKPALEG